MNTKVLFLTAIGLTLTGTLLGFGIATTTNSVVFGESVSVPVKTQTTAEPNLEAKQESNPSTESVPVSTPAPTPSPAPQPKVSPSPCG